MNHFRKYRESFRVLAVILIALNLVIALISYKYYMIEKRRFEQEIDHQLDNIADLKVNQVVDWRHERLSDANFLSRSQEIMANFLSLAKEPGNMALRTRFFNNLNAMFLNGKYEAMLAVTRDGRNILSIHDTLAAITETTTQDIERYSREKVIVMSDFYLNRDSLARIEIVVPMSGPEPSLQETPGWIILIIDPDMELTRLLKTVHVPAKTLDVSLVSRHDKDSSGKGSLSAVRPIPETSWFLVVSMDRLEAYGDLRKIGINTALFALLLIIALTSSILLFWVRHNGEMKTLELQKQVLSEQYDWLSKYANDAILLYDNNLEIMQVNDKAQEKYGYTEKEFNGITLDRLTADNAGDDLKEKLSQIIRSGGQRYESMHLRKDGTSFPVEVSTRFVDFSGKSLFQSIVRDITERKKIEQALLESEERMRLITNSLPQIVWTAKPDGKVDYLNSRFELLTGLFPFRGNALQDSIHPDDLNRAIAHWKKAMLEEIPNQFELRIRMKDGNYRWFLNMGIPLHDSNGKMIKWFGSATDIDDLKRTEQELHRRELLLRNAVNNLPSSFTVYDDQGRIEYINDFSLILSDLTAEEAVGKKEEEIFPEAVTNSYLHVLYNTYKTKEPQVVECQVNYADSPRYVIYHFVPTLDENDNIYKVLGMAYDITERKNTEEKLKAAMRRAEESDRLKSVFLANISHEIRTPLNAIMGFSQMIQKTTSPDEQLRGYIDIIMASAEQLLDIIKQMIEISQLESGRSNVNLAGFSLADLMKEIYRTFAALEKQKINKGLAFTLDMDPGLASTDLIVSDREKISNVLRNLLGNAFKFTREDGSISFGCRVHDKLSCLFYVKDTGIGIEENKQGMIFDAFRQADESYTRNFGGVGLGLAICRSLVTKLGGKIWVESKSGQGSVFYFTIPVKESGT